MGTREEAMEFVENLVEELFRGPRHNQEGAIVQRLVQYVAYQRILDEISGMTHTEFEIIESFVNRWAAR